jgi:hypothetical protein
MIFDVMEEYKTLLKTFKRGMICPDEVDDF